MVSSIPPPDLTTLLPPFLSHIPASFASTKAPPSLPPLLTPLTRSRLAHLSFSTTPFLTLLTWSSESDGELLHDHLTSQDYYFLEQPASPQTYIFKGSKRLDVETLQCLVEVPELSLLIIYQFCIDDVINESGDRGNSWKVHDLRLSDDEDKLGTWHRSIDTAEEAFRSQPQQSTNAEPMDEDEDDYWGRYDDEDTESSAGDKVSHHSSPQLASSIPKPTAEDEYYARYADVEPALDHGEVAQSIHTPQPHHIRRDSISTSRTDPSHTTLSTPITTHTLSQSPTTKKLEVAAELHSQNDIAIKQHVSTSLKSLYRLWKASGGDAEDFGDVVMRELEVLKMVEENEELGSQ